MNDYLLCIATSNVESISSPTTNSITRYFQLQKESDFKVNKDQQARYLFV